MSKRFEELDSLRGLAAMSVVLLHFFLAISRFYPDFYLISKLNNTPLHIFWGGTEAVFLFFVLSGFVLSLAYYKSKIPMYKDYIIKRICRIYIPYLVSVIFASLCMLILYRENLPAFGGWFNVQENKFPIKLLFSHVTMLGEFDSYKINVVYWSLVHEMRVSIIFPVVMFFILKFSWKKNLSVAFIFSISFFLIYFFIYKVFKHDITINSTSYFSSIRFLSLFMLGALLARYSEFIQSVYKKTSVKSKIMLVAVGILAYTYPWWFFNGNSILHLSFINDMMIAVGCVIFIILSINSNTLSSILLFKPLRFIGKISYSLYLFHMIVLLSMLYGLYGRISTIFIFIVAFVLSFIVASIMYFFIEKPSIVLGQKLTTQKKRKIRMESESAKKYA